MTESLPDLRPPPDRERRLLALEEGSNYLLSLIRGEAVPSRQLSRAEAIVRGKERLDRMTALLAALDDPHRAYPCVHVAGTSGKGSVASFVAAICEAAGIRTGLHMSPYLQSPLEKLAVGERLASPEEFFALVKWIQARYELLQVADPEFEPSYGSTWVALTLEFFRRRRVDLGVVEVGAGGRFDLTNVVSPAVSAVTSVGMDHVVSLGPTLVDIAYHKGGVFKPGVPAVAIERADAAFAMLKACALEVCAPLRALRPDADFGAVEDETDPAFWFKGHNFSIEPVRLGLKGDHQIPNAAVACAICDALVEGGFPITAGAVTAGLGAARVPGRWEVFPGEPEVLLDGAHNPDKAAALAAALGRYRRGRRTAIVLGILGYKAAEAILEALAPCADLIVATEPRVYRKPALPARELAALARVRGFKALIRPDGLDALDAAADFAGAAGLVCVTGSLYLVGEVRERWYPAAEIAVQGTSWPVSNA